MRVFSLSVQLGPMHCGQRGEQCRLSQVRKTSLYSLAVVWSLERAQSMRPEAFTGEHYRSSRAVDPGPTGHVTPLRNMMQFRKREEKALTPGRTWGWAAR